MSALKLKVKHVGEDDEGIKIYKGISMEVRVGEVLDYSHMMYKLIDGRLYNYKADADVIGSIKGDVEITLYDEDKVRYITSDIINYSISDEEYNLITGYAEGHDLELVVKDGVLKLQDIQNREDYWAVGLFDIVEWLSDANSDLTTSEEELDEPDIKKLDSLKEDAIIIDALWSRMWDKLNENKFISMEA